MIADVTLDRPLLQSAKRLSRRMTEHGISLYLTGLAASGKSTVAAYLAQLTGIPLVDTGLPFRLATYLYRAIPAAAVDKSLFDRLLQAHTIRIIAGNYRVFSGEEDITDRLRTTEIDDDVPTVAGDPRTREHVLNFLRKTTIGPAIVAARGATEPFTGGHVLQLELSASLQRRIERRRAQGSLPSETVRKSIRERDRRDLQGAARYPSSDVIDTTHLTVEESLARVITRANERISRLYGFRQFRRVKTPPLSNLDNPLLSAAWNMAKEFVDVEEERQGVARGQTRGKFLLRLSRFGVRDLFVGQEEGISWPPGTFPGALPGELRPSPALLELEAGKAVSERKAAEDAFFEQTELPRGVLEALDGRTASRSGGKLLVTDSSGKLVERLLLKDASPELGWAIEKHLHYLGTPRADSTHRIVLVEESTDYPVLYLSFAPNTRKYTEPLLWAFGLRMEEVAVAVRGYGMPRCPRNAMGLFLRLACNKVTADFPHLRAILTDINPNWGYVGQSFREADFIDVGLKHAPTSFVGEDYATRRELSDRHGKKAAISARLPLVPTLIMLRPASDDDELRTQLKVTSEDGLYLIPRSMYDKG